MWITTDQLLLLLLLLTTNGAPLLARELLHSGFNHPIDRGHRLASGQPLLGPSKTWRGVIAALLLTPLVSLLLGLGWLLGLVIALFAMLGDISSSFIKRRLGMPSSSMALGLDQIPESLLPLLACRLLIELPLTQLALLVVLFFITELLLSRVLFWLHIRRHPY
ncbi:hypothetical protein QQ73_19790 [Candidatus Endoriftia persephone str. Guaymas]|jgi:CDP-2,3-bis-(O-geranylgeranyl)-sn-glycerol synthase|uniref:CDP-archaeol synthase n=3 Tax=Gammaproteobacteria TaxID=1236 RepID=G2FBL6_9GAMM|nr:CDP-archaeol synthase [Candidatus Endoriftia persephone]EGV52696.1 hypothetical protein Rifp1Sym_ad00430 [endosymbiont of Riftia pachyptila (vent Ph05)]EGW55697.1 hypothetical protein TevJSym_ab00490 [endosymbiont of Tevnia jerichonana (vent Tica)]MBA1333199.1 hypothetical protein [Candidatus Endoriftia persephone str. Guaymas]USF86314.1 CDP-archaeol synthase [Candidatus Endoriftia persephone]